MIKNLLLLVLLCSLGLNAQKIDRKTMYDYSENVEFRIFGLTKQRSVDRGAGQLVTTIVAKKGERFVTIIFDFKNKSSETQIIAFDNIFLRDKTGELHKVDYLQVAGVRFTGKSYQQKLKGNKKRKIIVQFVPPFPKEELINTIVLDGKTIELKYP